MESRTTKRLERCDVTVYPDVYGIYNRRVEAWTSKGLVVGVVTEEQTGNIELGGYNSLLVEIETFFSGQQLVCRIPKQ